MDPDSIPTELGDFRVVAELGRGGSGVVYDACWGPRRVALKVLHPGLVRTERLRAQFLAEAQRLQGIAHPSVVKVLAVGELPDGRPYLAMERLEGETLASVLARGPMVLSEALAIFGELCTAVGALHDRSVIHRDLKPENVFIVDGRHAVLLDFGIAKDLEAPASTTTMDGGVRGTPAYMAPERFFGQPAGVTTDIYELAVTLYAMLAGRLPWDDLADPEARLSPRPLVELAEVPAELDIEIRRALSTRAQNRPSSAGALLEATRRAAGATSEPAASDTARLARASHEGTSPSTGQHQPWFADRHRTTDRGKTPLAWAPTEPAPVPVAPPSPRRRWAIVVGGMVAAAAIGGVIAWRLGGPETGEQLATAAVGDAAGAVSDAIVGSTDPWASSSIRPASPPRGVTFETSGTPISTEQARKEAVAAIQHVPADTRVVFSVMLGELRRNEQFDVVLGKLAAHPKVASFKESVPPCVTGLLAGAEWAIYASASLRDSEHATLIIRGRWQRGDVEDCFAPDTIPLTMPDGKQMLQLKRVGWIDFLDDHTIYLSVRDDLAAAQVHDLVKRGNGPAAHTKELLATLPVERTLAVAIDGSAGLEWPKEYLPRASDATAWLRVDDVTEFAVTADTHSEQAAIKLVAQVRPTFDELFADKQASILGSTTVTRDKTAMRIHGKLSQLMIAMIIAAIP